MSFSDFIEFLAPNTIDFYLNSAGYLTCDERHHLSLFQTFIVHHWARFAKIVGPQQLFKALEELNSSSVLKFNSSGELVDPPLAIYTLLQAEKRHTTLASLLQNRTDIVGIIAFLISASVLLFVAKKLTLFDSIKDALNGAFPARNIQSQQ